MKKVLYVLNDCMRKFSFERVDGLYRALRETGEPFSLHILRSDAYDGFAPEHNCGEYNIYRLPDYSEFDAILLDVNSVFHAGSNAYGAQGIRFVVRAAAASGKPVISLANNIPGFHYIGVDNYGAMTSVIRHLHVDHGLSDFWFALGPSDNYENRARTKALADYCAANGLPCGEDRFYADSFVIECGIEAFRTLYARHGGTLPQAVVCANDHIAMGVCLAAKEAGLRVPDDFLVTGFDNAALSASFSPSITTVDQQSRSLCDACVVALRRIWNGESVPESLTTSARLVLRESTERVPYAGGGALPREPDYIGGPASSTDFNYQMSAMQYRLPGCRSIEEIGRALIECVSALNCDGLALVLDGRLFDLNRVLSFREQTGQLRDISGDLCVEGYSDTMELVFLWEKGKEPRFPRQRLGGAPSSLPLADFGANCLFAPLHFMERTAGYLCMRNGLDLMRIKGVSAVVGTLTMALRNYFSAQSLSYINQVLSGVSMRDGLTGLYNRLGYHELAYPLYRDVAGRGGRLAILFLDLDRLKQINDAYGHGAGDQAIVCVASALRQSLPAEALPVRYGGDEFLALVPDAEEETARRLLRDVAEAIPALADSLGVPETPGVSAGFVLSEPDGGKTLDEYVEKADALMYRDKRAKKAQRD